MKEVQVALYARVSSEQQAEAKTIESQLAEIRTRIGASSFELTNILEFVDEGVQRLNVSATSARAPP
jgi:site-specific DNA recombinase